MPVVPGGFDEDSSQMRIAGFGDGTVGAFRAARMLRGDEAHEGHGRGRAAKAARIAELGGDRQRGEIVDAAEAAQALDPGSQRLEIEQRAEVVLDRAETGD